MRSPVKRNIGLTNRTAKALAGFFIYHDDNYHARSERDFQVVDFVKTQRAARSTGRGAPFILRKWIDFSGHRENVLTPEWKTIGVGVTRNIWVIDLRTNRLSVLIVKLNPAPAEQVARIDDRSPRIRIKLQISVLCRGVFAPVEPRQSARTRLQHP
jgi:hypothetical protein